MPNQYLGIIVIERRHTFHIYCKGCSHFYGVLPEIRPDKTCRHEIHTKSSNFNYTPIPTLHRYPPFRFKDARCGSIYYERSPGQRVFHTAPVLPPRRPSRWSRGSVGSSPSRQASMCWVLSSPSVRFLRWGLTPPHQWKRGCHQSCPRSGELHYFPLFR